MTVVLTDQELDRAEAFRLAKRFPLPPEVAMSDSPDVVQLRSFVELNGLGDFPIIQRILACRTASAMTRAISRSGITYAERLSHVCRLEDPIVFSDLRAAVGTMPPPDRVGGVPEPASAPEERDGTAEAVP